MKETWKWLRKKRVTERVWPLRGKLWGSLFRHRSSTQTNKVLLQVIKKRFELTLQDRRQKKTWISSLQSTFMIWDGKPFKSSTDPPKLSTNCCRKIKASKPSLMKSKSNQPYRAISVQTQVKSPTNPANSKSQINTPKPHENAHP
jgi:hypothetical protein